MTKTKKTALQLAQIMDHHDIVVILDRGQIQKDDKNVVIALVTATEAVCPKVVADF